jgi:branched-chain amino acid aminotransferase
MKVFIDDRIVDEAGARVSVLDHGLLYGDGVFEGIRVYAGAIFRLDAHLERILLAARSIGIEVAGGLPRLRAIVQQTVAAAGLDEAYARLLITRGDGPLGVDPTECSAPRVICIVDEIEIYAAEKVRRGLDLITASVRRARPDVLDPRVKSLNYLTSVLAKREARLRGADEALLLNREGTVAEATVANVFACRHGQLITPSPLDGILEGITRAVVLELARGLGIPTRERRLGRLDLLGADEAFLTGTGVEIVPLRSLDGQEIGSERPGPVTSKLMAAFRDLICADASA